MRVLVTAGVKVGPACQSPHICYGLSGDVCQCLYAQTQDVLPFQIQAEEEEFCRRQ